MNCGAPGCTAPAVRQWLRAGTDDEAAAYQASLHARHVERAERAAAEAAIQLAELRDRRARMVAAGSATPAVLEILDRQTATAEHAATAPAPVLARHAAPEPVTIPLAGCAEHAVDEHAAAGLHHETCVPGGCGCTPTYPEPHTL